MKRYSFQILFLFLFTANLKAQENNSFKLSIDSLFTSLDTSSKFMGTVVMRQHGDIIYQNSCGYRIFSDTLKLRNDSNTHYRIGSITKMLTAVMIFQLLEEKKLYLNTTLDQFYPKIKFAPKITIGHLLNHHSGIFDLTMDPRYKEWSLKNMTEAQIIDILASYTSKDEPGKKAYYSNSNYILLGFILEKITHQSFAKNLNQRILQPLGLKNTYYNTKLGKKPNEAWSYRLNSGKWDAYPVTNLSVPSGAGAVISTPNDISLFLSALFDGQLISAGSLQYMYSKSDGFGMGMFQYPFMDKKGWGHSGGIDAFSSMAAFFPQDSMTITLCSNGQVYPINDVILGILSLYYGKPYIIPTFNQVRLSTTELDAYVGEYSSTQIPVKVKVTREGNTLMAQGSGKSSYPLEATDKHKFIFTAGGIIMEFFPEKGGMNLKQGGLSYYFTRN